MLLLVPVLLDPRGALESAAGEPPLCRAEIELLAGDPKRAEKTLSAHPAGPGEEARRLRLEVDAAVAAGEVRVAEAAIDRLAEMPGWRAHAKRARLRLAALGSRADIQRFGSLLFALATAVLMLGAARELLRVRTPVMIFCAAVAGVFILARFLPAPIANAVGLLSLAMLFLLHATAGAIARVRPSAKGRLFLLTTLLLGTSGAMIGIVEGIDPAVLGAMLG